jgi:8-oxo-dGTP pyrophosphatase MutT (NUDIX family)
MIFSLCGTRCKPPTRAEITDARAGKDPTKTYYLRARMRSESDQRWQHLARTVREALIDQDIIGLRGVSRLPHGDKAQGFASWLDQELRQKVLGIDGRWVRPYIRNAAEIAQRHAHQYTPTGQHDPLRTEQMENMAVRELQGIVAAAQQQITRVVTEAMMKNASPTAAANAVAGVIYTMRHRTCAMDEWMIARTHATTTLSIFRNAGVQRVGIIPERKRRREQSHDHMFDAPQRRGPGSRTRGKTPSPSTIRRIEKAQAGDNDVCIVCEDISDEGPYDLDEAEDLIPAHPWCRCAFVPAGTLEDSALVFDALKQAAGIIFKTPTGEMLLMKRSDTGEWSIPAGMLEENETPRHAAHRESAEETGNPGNHSAFKVHSRTRNGLRFHTYVQPSEWQFKPILNPEHTEYGWFHAENLPEPLHPGLVATLHSMTEGGGAIPSSR